MVGYQAVDDDALEAEAEIRLSSVISFPWLLEKLYQLLFMFDCALTNAYKPPSRAAWARWGWNVTGRVHLAGRPSRVRVH